MNRRKFVILNIVIIFLFIIFFILLYFSVNLIFKDFTDISLYSAKSSKLPWNELLLYLITFVILPLSVLIIEVYMLFHIKNQFIFYTLIWLFIDIIITYTLWSSSIKTVSLMSFFTPFGFSIIKCIFRIIKKEKILK